MKLCGGGVGELYGTNRCQFECGSNFLQIFIQKSNPTRT